MAGLAPSGEAWMLKAGGATGSTWPGKPRQGQAGPQGQDRRAGLFSSVLFSLHMLEFLVVFFL